jgi:hypothetical protein
MTVKIIFFAAIIFMFNSAHTFQQTINIDSTIREAKVILEGVCSFSLPNKLELQNGAFKRLNELGAKIYGLDNESDQYWLQQSGLNNNNAEAYKHFVRISFGSKVIGAGPFDSRKLFELTPEDVSLYDDLLDPSINAHIMSKTLSIEKSKVSKVGNYYALEKKYISKTQNKPIKVNIRYLFIVDSKNYIIKLEYWEKDFKEFENAINRVFNTMDLLE